jgi:hypothetical protein
MKPHKIEQVTLPGTLTLILTFAFLFAKENALAQCKQRISEATNKIELYQKIPLTNENEYLLLTSSGDEKVFAYRNEVIDLVFHAQMFTEIRFTTEKGNFSLFATSADRTRWQTCLILEVPLTAQDVEKMKTTTKIEVFLPEDMRAFKLEGKKSDQFKKGLTCLF